MRPLLVTPMLRPPLWSRLSFAINVRFLVFRERERPEFPIAPAPPVFSLVSGQFVCPQIAKLKTDVSHITFLWLPFLWFMEGYAVLTSFHMFLIIISYLCPADMSCLFHFPCLSLSQLDLSHMTAMSRICAQNKATLEDAEPRRLREEVARLKSERVKLIEAKSALKVGVGRKERRNHHLHDPFRFSISSCLPLAFCCMFSSSVLASK